MFIRFVVFFSRLIRRILTYKVRHLEVLRATAPQDFEEIAAFNYRIFTKEIGQHPENPQQKLVDSYHEANTYFVAKDQGRIVGMVCLTDPRVKGFSVAKKMADPRALEPYKQNSFELRMLAIEKGYRGCGLFWRLSQVLVEFTLSTGAQYVFISGILEKAGLYRMIGFEPIAPPAGSGRARFMPMRLSRERFLALRPLLGL